MVDSASIRNKLDNSLFNRFGKSVTFKKVTTPTYNSRGEITSTSYTESTITIVDYSITTGDKSREKWGEVRAGDRVAAIRYDVDVEIDDLITIRGVDYRVINVREPELPDVVVILAHLTKVN